VTFRLHLYVVRIPHVTSHCCCESSHEEEAEVKPLVTGENEADHYKYIAAEADEVDWLATPDVSQASDGKTADHYSCQEGKTNHS